MDPPSTPEHSVKTELQVKETNLKFNYKNSKDSLQTFEQIKILMKENEHEPLTVLGHITSVIGSKLDRLKSKSPVDFSRIRNSPIKQQMYKHFVGLVGMTRDPKQILHFINLERKKQDEVIRFAMYVLSVVCDYNRPNYSIE